jgi:hypothetical protein
MHLCHITALAMLLTFICHHIVVCRTHSQEARKAHGLIKMVHPRDDSADFERFIRRPMLQVTSCVAERFQDCRDIHIDSISERGSKSGDRVKQNSVYGSARNNTVISIVLAAACVIILVSSHHLADSMTPKNTERRSVWQRLEVLLITFLVGLTECVAVCVSRRGSGHHAVAEDVISTALGSTARLLSALLSVSTLVGWLLGTETSVLPIDAFHCALLVVALLMQMVGEGW